MELIYVYIDNYRTFEKQSISFSDKFIVDYDDEGKKLDITRNTSYFDMYPKNIVGISGIVGKNATGKTSLLSLIGKTIQNRHRANEIFIEKKRNTYEANLLEFIDKSGDIKYNSTYFLLYSYEKNSEGEDIFIVETNCIKKVVSFFSNRMDFSKYGLSEEYFEGKGWFCGVFKRSESKNIYIGNILNFHNDGDRYKIQEELAIISFENIHYSSMFSRAVMNKEEQGISIRRIEAVLENIYQYQKLQFLISQMKIARAGKTMYSNEVYFLKVKFSSKTPWPSYDQNFNFEEIIKDFRNFKILDFSEEEKIMLAFLYAFTCYIFTVLVYSGEEISGEQQEIIDKLKKISNDAESYLDIKEIYHQKIDKIFQLKGNEDISLLEFINSEKALENFLKTAPQHHIDYEYYENSLKLKITREAQLEGVKSFFDEFIDENASKNFQEKDPVLGNFLSVDILDLSDGERANLSLFTSIHEQIQLCHIKKKKYILLFDEIERSMHPEMCRCLITDLIKFLGSYEEQEFQIIIGSHSPFIISDMKKENVICLSREGKKSVVKLPTFKTFGQNIHTILKESFFLESTFGEYSVQLINLIVNSIILEDTSEMIEVINNFLYLGAIDYSEKKLSSEKEVFDFISAMIASIGEPLIREQLEEMLTNKINKQYKQYTTEQKIAYHQEEINRLRAEEENQ